MTFREPYGVGDIHLGMSRICEYMHNLSLFETVLIHTITGTYAQQRRWCGIYRIRMTRRDQIWDSAHGDCNARALFHPMASAEREKKRFLQIFIPPDGCIRFQHTIQHILNVSCNPQSRFLLPC